MRFVNSGIGMATIAGRRWWRAGAAATLSLLTLAACTANPGPVAETTPSPGLSETLGQVSLPAPEVMLNLRGSLDEREKSPAPAETFAVPALGPDEKVATESINRALAARPQFDIKMGFAPGDGATALSTALQKALTEAAPKGIAGRFRIDGHVDISSTETGDTDVALTWAIRRADGALMGEVTQTTTTSPSKIASFWGDFAKSAADPAAKGIAALIAGQSRQQGNAS